MSTPRSAYTRNRHWHPKKYNKIREAEKHADSMTHHLRSTMWPAISSGFTASKTTKSEQKHTKIY